MNYVNLATGKAISKKALIQANKHVSLPKEWSEAVYETLNIAPIQSVSAPKPSSPYKSVIKGDPANVDGVWQETWSEVDTFSDTPEKTKAEQEAEYQAELDSNAATRNRQRRDGLLNETDWWAVSDRTMTDEQSSYRTSLRDITTHENWPHLTEDDWPIKP
jgi:hypothetical protein